MVGKGGNKAKKKNHISVTRIICLILIIYLNFILLVFITTNFCICRLLLIPLMGLFHSSARILPLHQACLSGNIDYESVYF